MVEFDLGQFWIERDFPEGQQGCLEETGSAKQLYSLPQLVALSLVGWPVISLTDAAAVDSIARIVRPVLGCVHAATAPQ